MAHIAFVGVSAAGHINPTLGVVAELVARGHQVSYAVTADFAPRVQRAGARAVCHPTTMGDFAAASGSFSHEVRFTASNFVTMMGGLLRETVAVLPVLARAFAEHRPDVVVHDATYGWAGRILAARWGVPAVRSQPMMAANRAWALTDGYAEFDPSVPGAALLAGQIAALLRRLRVDLAVNELIAGDDNQEAIVFLPRAFQYAGDTFGPRTHFVGPCLWRSGGLPTPASRAANSSVAAPPPAQAGPAREEPPRVVVAFGTVYHHQPRLYRDCVAALAELGWAATIAIGPRTDPAELGTLPPTIRTHRVIPDLLAELARARVFVNHASMASTMESLALGVPVLAVPQIAEHRANADRLVELGLGASLAPGEVDPAAVRDALLSLAGDAGIADRVAAMRAAIDEAGGARGAADVVEALLVPSPVS